MYGWPVPSWMRCMLSSPFGLWRPAKGVCKPLAASACGAFNEWLTPTQMISVSIQLLVMSLIKGHWSVLSWDHPFHSLASYFSLIYICCAFSLSAFLICHGHQTKEPGRYWLRATLIHIPYVNEPREAPSQSKSLHQRHLSQDHTWVLLSESVSKPRVSHTVLF